MNREFIIRFITPADAREALDVYAPYVLNTAISFEYEVPTVADFTEKIKKITAQYPWLVCEHKGTVIGYAYGSTHRDRTAYQWSPESTVYLAEGYHRMDIARVLYTALFKMLRMQGYFNAFAGVLVSNEKSVAFHKAMGFEEIGLFKNIGFKLGEWHTNLWLQYTIQEHVLNPPIPTPVRKLPDNAIQEILKEANEQVKGKTIVMNT